MLLQVRWAQTVLDRVCSLFLNYVLFAPTNRPPSLDDFSYQLKSREMATSTSSIDPPMRVSFESIPFFFHFLKTNEAN